MSHFLNTSGRRPLKNGARTLGAAGGNCCCKVLRVFPLICQRLDAGNATDLYVRNMPGGMFLGEGYPGLDANMYYAAAGMQNPPEGAIVLDEINPDDVIESIYDIPELPSSVSIKDWTLDYFGPFNTSSSCDYENRGGESSGPLTEVVFSQLTQEDCIGEDVGTCPCKYNARVWNNYENIIPEYYFLGGPDGTDKILTNTDTVIGLVNLHNSGHPSIPEGTVWRIQFGMSCSGPPLWHGWKTYDSPSPLGIYTRYLGASTRETLEIA